MKIVIIVKMYAIFHCLPKVGASVRGAVGFSFVHNRSHARHKRPVANVRVPYNPPHVGGRHPCILSVHAI